METTNPFQRTTCACEVCVTNCKTQPGCLAPGDVERIVAVVGKDPKEFLVASPGALAKQGQRLFRIGTITPASVKGRCVLLGPDDRCTIHTVAPFGCAYFDCRMSAAEGQRRSAWMHKRILESPEYQIMRASLPLATHYKPKGY